MHYRLGQHGRFFATQERGAAVRRAIESALSQLPATEPLILDFAGVELMSFSAADEIVGRLLADRTPDTVGVRPILLTNANDDVLETIGRSLSRRKLMTAHIVDDRLVLVGTSPAVQQAYAAAQSRRAFTASELAGDLGISAPACNNRLKPLVAAGLITRERSTPPSGGRAYCYRFVLPTEAERREVA